MVVVAGDDFLLGFGFSGSLVVFPMSFIERGDVVVVLAIGFLDFIVVVITNLSGVFLVIVAGIGFLLVFGFGGSLVVLFGGRFLGRGNLVVVLTIGLFDFLVVVITDLSGVFLIVVAGVGFLWGFGFGGSLIVLFGGRFLGRGNFVVVLTIGLLGFLVVVITDLSDVFLVLPTVRGGDTVTGPCLTGLVLSACFLRGGFFVVAGGLLLGTGLGYIRIVLPPGRFLGRDGFAVVRTVGLLGLFFVRVRVGAGDGFGVVVLPSPFDGVVCMVDIDDTPCGDVVAAAKSALSISISAIAVLLKYPLVFAAALRKYFSTFTKSSSADVIPRDLAAFFRAVVLRRSVAARAVPPCGLSLQPNHGGT